MSSSSASDAEAFAMSQLTLDPVFTLQNPLGPIVVSDDADPRALQLIYDTRVNLHVRSAENPPTFIVGRRGSGKTALLLSREFDQDNLAVRLRADRVYSLVQAMVGQLEEQVAVPVEAVADIWELLLWAPIATRLAAVRHPQDPPAARQILWEETAPFRRLPDTCDVGDAVVELAATLLSRHLDGPTRVLSAGSALRDFTVVQRPWAQVVTAARDLLAARGLPVFVLIDSLENIGAHIDRLRPTLQGLCHLVGKLGVATNRRPYTLQCCFPSELWTRLDDISANPVKDFAGRMVLQWRWRDLLQATGMRLRSFLEVHYPQLAEQAPGDSLALLDRLFPPRITDSCGADEPTYAYILRHTQLLPRQVFYIINEALHRALLENGAPEISPRHIVEAVRAVEAALCPEVFSAHAYCYPQAHAVARQLIPFLPFRFDDGLLHRMCNQAGIRKHFGLDYQEVREMFATVGILGRFFAETSSYVSAEFAYSVDGQLLLSPEEEYCLHPLFVRQYRSVDLVPGRPRPKPVYPTGVPVE
jgi:hypothetical protein